MFDEPEETPAERTSDPKQRAMEKADEFRMHAQLAAVFEGVRKFNAQLRPGFDADKARDVQRGMAKLEKAKTQDSPIVPNESADEARAILNVPLSKGVSTNDYHIHRRPGEVMIVRWIEGEDVETFYERLQAHFDVAFGYEKEEEKTASEWKQDPKTLEYLAALDAIEVKMADRYLRDIIRTHQVFVLSTQTVDEMDILHLCDYVMGVPAAEVVGDASAPGDEPTEADRAWFFKLFSLRGVIEGVERMCFFTYLQKSDDSGW